MDRRPERKAAKRGREEEDNGDFPFEEAAGDGGVGEASRRPPGVFQLPWQKCRSGLGVPAGGGAPGWELRDVFFRSLVDGGAAAIGVPGDRLVSPPFTRRALLDVVDAWLAVADDATGSTPSGSRRSMAAPARPRQRRDDGSPARWRWAVG